MPSGERVQVVGGATRQWLAELRGPGHGEATRELVLILERRLRATFGRSGLSEADFADLVQESLVRVLSSLDSFRGDASFPTWATTVALRVVLDHLRARRRQSEHAPEGTEPETIRALDLDPAQSLELREALGVLERALTTSLSPRQRATVTSLLEGVPIAEIAARSSSTPGAVYKRYHDARKLLRRALERAGHTRESIGALLTSRSATGRALRPA